MKRIVALIFLLTLLTATVGFSQTDDRAAFDESLIKTITDLVPDTDNLCSLAGSSFQPGDEILAINGEHPTQKLPYIASHNSFSNRETLLCYGSYL